ncbi:unnamed protein product [Mytilus edulis]|uniref:WSC domain-containing protein n=1 Tax=Mytilus edulis TaxID=6550 RepID=A0A8S3TWL6_MYTED|nr:unnamed protein product [Mytilus edulis]
MTNGMCASHCCSVLNYATFMGTEYSRRCYCSNVSNSDNFVPCGTCECNMQCDGNLNEICGGVWSLSVYKIECSPDTTVTTYPQTTSDRSTVIPEMTTQSTLAANSSSTTSLAQFTPMSSVGNNNSVCSCANCMKMNNTIWTEKELAEKLSVLRKAISINKKETNLYKATKMSAYDPRKSSRNIGIVGIIVLVVPVIFVLVIDAQRICQ